MLVQYDLFQTEKESEFESLKKEFTLVKQSADKVRRGIFARHNELAKEFLILKQEHEILIRNICKNETMLRPHRAEIREMESTFSNGTSGSFASAQTTSLLACGM